MKEVDYSTYERELNEFIRKHSKKSDLHIWTSAFVNGQYHKDYLFEDGATFTEVNEHDYKEMVVVELHGKKIQTIVRMIRHEYWSTDDSESHVWYESIM